MNGASGPGRRVLLNRLYRRYGEDPRFASLRERAGGVVPGDGSCFPRLMFVGEAPGRNEDKQRKPFIGASGKFLDELLASVDMAREDVFITNAVKYRPVNEAGGNRPPAEDELHGSLPYLREEMRILGWPPVVVLGKHARRTVSHGYKLPYGLTIGEWVWMQTRYGGHAMLPLYHPAYGLYQQRNKPMMFEQFKAVLAPPEGPL